MNSVVLSGGIGDGAGNGPAAAFAHDPQAGIFLAAGDIQAAALSHAARHAGIPAEIVHIGAEGGGQGRPWLRLALEGRVVYCSEGKLFEGSAGAALEECRHLNGANIQLLPNKSATKLVVETLGLPVPRGREFASDDQAEAEAYFTRLGQPVCIKPLWGSLGNAVQTCIADLEDFRRAFDDAAALAGRVLVEQYIPGEVFRFFFIRPIVAGIRRDIPANVEGDGISSIRELLRRKNALKRRRTGQKPAAIGFWETRLLARQGLAPESIPAAGARVFLRSVSNADKGGDSLGWPADLHPSYARKIGSFCNAMHDLHIAAVDAILREPSEPAAPDNFAVIELNCSPGMVQFHFPWSGMPQDIAGAILRRLRYGDSWAEKVPG